MMVAALGPAIPTAWPRLISWVHETVGAAEFSPLVLAARDILFLQSDVLVPYRIFVGQTFA
jgi:hypothetical protein